MKTSEVAKMLKQIYTHGQVADRGITAHESTRAEESEATAMIIVRR